MATYQNNLVGRQTLMAEFAKATLDRGQHFFCVQIAESVPPMERLLVARYRETSLLR